MQNRIVPLTGNSPSATRYFEYRVTLLMMSQTQSVFSRNQSDDMLYRDGTDAKEREAWTTVTEQILRDRAETWRELASL